MGLLRKAPAFTNFSYGRRSPFRCIAAFGHLSNSSSTHVCPFLALHGFSPAIHPTPSNAADTILDSGFFYDRTKTSQLAVVFSSFSSAGSTLNNTEQSLSQLASRLSRSDPSGQQDGIICSLHSFGSRVRCTSRKQLGSLSCATHYGRCSGAWTWCLYLSTVCIIEGFRSPTHLTPLVFLVLGFFLGHILPSDL
ncbi:uncharacterized protein LOC143875437 isoform X1 [Tasmannia lanceolata]|uniref:uncharacterized protein LOC143875437 isoform X1 n=1 Tax=Tasmannia lanceolata TaxID=3420 RepID=UPI004062F977